MRLPARPRFRLYFSCLISALVTVSCTSSEMHPTAMSGAGGQRAGFDEVIGQHARTMLDEGRGLWTHQKGGFYHDGRFATLRDVVNHYDGFLRLGLTELEKNDLIQHLLGL
jgi:hypothetical protein